MIPSLLLQIQEVDLDIVVDWDTHADNRVFKRAFICLGATRHAFQYTQPLVCLDACHTKNQKYPIQLFVATMLDGSMKGYTLWYVVAPMENTDNWIWFLCLLEKSIHNIHPCHPPHIRQIEGFNCCRARGVPGKSAQVLCKPFAWQCENAPREGGKQVFLEYSICTREIPVSTVPSGPCILSFSTCIVLHSLILCVFLYHSFEGLLRHLAL